MPGGTVRPTSALILPYFTNSSLLVQWALPPLHFLLCGTVGPNPDKLLHYMQIHPWWQSGIHICPTSSLLHNFFPRGTSGPASFLVLPRGTVGPIPVKLLPHMQNVFLVAQWAPLMHKFFHTL